MQNAYNGSKQAQKKKGLGCTKTTGNFIIKKLLIKNYVLSMGWGMNVYAKNYHNDEHVDSFRRGGKHNLKKGNH